MIGDHQESRTPEEAPRERDVEVRGEVIERERRRRQWTVADLARISGISARTLNGIPPNGTARVKLTTLRKLTQAFREHPADDLADEAMAGRADQ